MTSKYWIICVFFITLSFSCKNEVARKPVTSKSSSVFDRTVELNKKNLDRENILIENYIERDSFYEYKTSKKGFWYAYINKNTTGLKPVKGDLIVYEQEVLDLGNEILHSKNELGLQSYLVDKEQIIDGLQEGLKLMREGEEMKFIFSSYVAFSTSGDKTKKIGVHEPIINTIKLINIKNQYNEH
jgi:gliding motility-associated peptidyl-prolyl isomerase